MTPFNLPSLAAESPPLAFLIEAALKGTALLAVAGLLALALRRASAAHRHLVWACALGGIVALPLLLATLPGWQVSAPALAWLAPGAVPEVAAPHVELTGAAPEVEAPNVPETPSTPSSASAISGSAANSATAPAPSEAGSAATAPSAWSWPATLLTLWVLGALLALGAFVAGHLALRVMLRDARAVRDGEWHALAMEAADRLGLTLPFALLRSDAVSVPVAFGLLRPRVLLPGGSDDWPLELRRAVLLHELAHVQRHDCLTQAIAQLACALFWFHPAVWWAASRLRVERERACDDRVLAARTRASDYADHLLGMARSLRATRIEALGAVAFARPSSLEGRLLAVLDPLRNRRPVSVRVAAQGALLAALLVLPFAAFEPVEATTVRGGWIKSSRHESRNPEAMRPSRMVAVPDPALPLEKRAEWARREAGAANAPVWWIGWRIETSESMKGNLLSDSEGIDLAILGRRGYFTLEDVIAGRGQGTSRQDETSEREQKPAAVLVRMDEGTPGRIRVQTFQLPADFAGQPLYWMDSVPDDQGFAWLRDAARQTREPRLRGQFIESIGFMSRSELVTPFLKSTLESDEDARVRRGAAEAFGRHPSPEVVRLLAKYAKSDRSTEVRRASVEALGHMKTAEALEELLAIAKVSEGDAQRAAFDALGEKVSDAAPDAGAPPGKRLREKSEKSEKTEKWEHVEETAPDADAADEPSQPMNAGDEEVQRQAIESLGRYPEEQSLPRLRQIAETSPNSELRAQAVESIGKLGTPGALALLDQIVWKNRHSRARQAAVEALGRRFPPDRALEKLTQIVRSHPSRETRRMAVESIGRLDSNGAEAALREAVDQGTDREVQRQAVESIGRRAGEDIENELVRIAKSHRSVEVRRQAVESLGRRKGTIDRLMEIARGEGPQEVQRQAVESLGRLADERVPALLLNLARNHSEIEVERQAVESLGRLESDVMPALAEIARSHPSSEVRRQAVETMTRRDPEKALPLIEEILRQPKRKGSI